MPSLNLDLNYFENIKTLRLMARLGPEADIYPIRLWAYAGKCQPGSSKLKLDAEEIETICRWRGAKGALVSELVFVKFLFKSGELFEINDWFEHSGHLAVFKKRAVKAARKRWMLAGKTSNASSIAKSKTSNASGNALAVLGVTKQTTNNIGAKKLKFAIPTPKQVTEYAKSIGFDLDGERFCDYYEAVGWLIGKRPMKNWQAAVRNWKSKRIESVGPKSTDLVI